VVVPVVPVVVVLLAPVWTSPLPRIPEPVASWVWLVFWPPTGCASLVLASLLMRLSAKELTFLRMSSVAPCLFPSQHWVRDVGGSVMLSEMIVAYGDALEEAFSLLGGVLTGRHLDYGMKAGLGQ
jgi:hypothetical protein